MRKITPISMILATLCILGCTTTGPHFLEEGHVLYNQAVNLTTREQLLLNLVRLRYRDTPTMLQVSSISTQYSISASAGVAADFDRHEGLTGYGGSLGLGYAEKPTVSFTPLQGDKFVTQVLSPIEPATLLSTMARLLLRSRENETGAGRSKRRKPIPNRLPKDPRFAPLVIKYQRSLVEVQADLHKARSSNDHDAVTNIAHRLHGTGANFGFPEISEAARDCEEKLHKGSMPDQVPELDLLEQVLQVAVAELADDNPDTEGS